MSVPTKQYPFDVTSEMPDQFRNDTADECDVCAKTWPLEKLAYNRHGQLVCPECRG